MNMQTHINSNRRQKGLAIVEFTIVLPLLLLLMLATAEFGRAFFQYNTLTKSVRDGTRHLSNYALNGATGLIEISTELESETKNLVVYGNKGGNGNALLPGLTTEMVTFEPPPAGNNVSVYAEYDYTLMVGDFLSQFGLDGPFTLRSTVTMRAL
jgi:Flp pilus assembly protein TadG